MKATELTIGKKYDVDGLGSIGTLKILDEKSDTVAFKMETEHIYFETSEGLVEFAINSDEFNGYKEIKD